MKVKETAWMSKDECWKNEPCVVPEFLRIQLERLLMVDAWCYKIICLGNLRSISIKKTNQSHLFRCSFNVSSFIVFSWVHNNLSSTPKEEGEELEKTENEEELLEEEENKS